MNPDLVWNEAEAKAIKEASDRAINGQIANMQDTARTYRSKAEIEDQKAKEEDWTAQTATKPSSWTDENGYSHTSQVPDLVARAAAAERAKAHREYAAALRTGATENENGARKLEDTLSFTNTLFKRLEKNIQETDASYARGFKSINDAILSYISAMQKVYNSFDDKLPMFQALGLESLKWGPVASVFSALLAGKYAGKVPSCAFGGDPVNLATGNFIYSKTDMEIPGRFPLAFTRFYNSSGGQDSALGPGWTHNYNIRLHAEDGAAHITFDDGHVESYTELEGGRYAAPLEKHAQLTKSENGYALTLAVMIQYRFDPDGFLKSIVDLNGNAIEFGYDKNGLLAEVKTAGGRFTFSYNTDGLLTEVKDDTGRKTAFEYEKGLLAKVTQPTGVVYQYAYDRQNRLCRLTNAEGIESLRNEYDDKGRMSRQYFADGGEIAYSYSEEGKTTTLKRQDGSRVVYERDNHYRTTGIVWPDGKESMVFDDRDQVVSSTNKRGFTTKKEYDSLGHITKVTDALGYETVFSYDKNKLLSVMRVDRLLASFSYDKSCNVTETKDALDRTIKLSYDKKGLPVKTVDPAGGTAKAEYDEHGNITAITDALGGVIRYEYDELNRVVQATDPEGNATSFCHDAAGRITEAVNAEGNTQHYSYNKRGKVTEFTDWDGSVIRRVYNEMGKLSEITDPVGGVTKYEYNNMWEISKATDANGGEWCYEYDQMNQPTRVTDPEGYQTAYVRDPNGNVTCVTAPSGAETKAEYDELDRQVKITDANGAETSFVYDAFSSVTEIHDPAGNVYKNEFDEAGQLIRKTDPLGNSVAYSYNKLGLVISETNEVNAVVHYERDALGRVTKVTNADGASESYEYNKNGQVISFVNALGGKYTYVRDCMNRIISITDPLGGVKRFEYDPMSRVTKRIDENGNATGYKYNAVGKLTCVVGADGSVTQYGYDLMQQLTLKEQYRSIDPDLADVQGKNEKISTKYFYDKRGLLAKEEDALGSAARYEYTPDGYLSREIGKDDSITNYEYDPVGLLTKTHYADGQEVMLSYDPLRRLAEMRDALDLTKIKTDEIGRITEVTDSENQTIRYGWTPAGMRESVTYPDGSTVNYSYDAAGRISHVIDGQETTATYRYNAMGNILERMLLNGIKTEYVYGELGNIQSLVHADATGQLDAFIYRYDLAGNKTEVQRTRRLPDGKDETVISGYSYDSMNRLTEVSQNGALLRSYGYDAFENRTRMADAQSGTVINYEYNLLNQLTNLNGPDGERTSRYDRRGNLASVSKDGVFQKSFRFDAANRMVSAVTADGSTAAYTYDGFGRRVKSVWDTSGPEARHEEKRYILDALKPYDNILMAYGEDGIGGASRHVWGNELISAGAAAESLAYCLHDELRSPVRITDTSGKSLSRFDYDEFGVPMPQEPGGSENGAGSGAEPFGAKSNAEPFSTNLFGFTGYQPDPVTGLNYAQARYYMPEAGRFVSEDTHWSIQNMIYGDNPGNIVPNNDAIIQSTNLYAYCLQNPMLYTDPTGNAGKRFHKAAMPELDKNREAVQDVLNTNVLGHDDIYVFHSTDESSYSTITHARGDIWVSTATTNLKTGEKMVGWKLNTPTITIGPIEYSSGLEWTGDSFGYNVSARDTLSKGVIQMGPFYDSYGLNVFLAVGQKPESVYGVSTSELTKHSKHVMSYGEYAILTAVVTMAVIFGPEIIAALGAMGAAGAAPAIAVGASSLSVLFGLDDMFKKMSDDFAKIKTDYMD